MKSLLIHADDFGLCEGVDRVLVDLASRGILTGVSLLIERCKPQALDRLMTAAPKLALGLHVDFTRDLLNFCADGLEERMAHQVESFVRLVGRKPDHTDTHKQTHEAYPGILPLLASLGCPVRAKSARTRRWLAARGIPHTDHFLGSVGKRSYWSWSRLLASLRNLPSGVTELMCHPGELEGMPVGLRYTCQRIMEAQTFGRAELPDRLRALGIKLGNSRELVRRT